MPETRPIGTSVHGVVLKLSTLGPVWHGRRESAVFRLPTRFGIVLLPEEFDEIQTVRLLNGNTSSAWKRCCHLLPGCLTFQQPSWYIIADDQRGAIACCKSIAAEEADIVRDAIVIVVQLEAQP